MTQGNPQATSKRCKRADANAPGTRNIVTGELAYGEGEALRVEDVMAILHLSKNTVYKLAREGSLPSFKVGRQLRFNYNDVYATLAKASGEAPVVHQPVVAHVGSEPGAAASVEPFAGNDPADEIAAWARGALIIGGQEMVGDIIANYMNGLGTRTLSSHANSYVSLSRMYLGTCHAAVVGLWSEHTHRYNTPYFRRMLPGVPCVAFRLYKHRVGLTTSAKCQLHLEDWSDLMRQGVTLANRELGASTRVLLDEKIVYMEERPDRIAGYDKPATSELAQALLVARGMADVAVTSEKPFRQIKGLAFKPLQNEVLDFIVLKNAHTASFIKGIRSLLRTDAFRSEFDPTLYDTSLMGEVVYEC